MGGAAVARKELAMTRKVLAEGGRTRIAALVALAAVLGLNNVAYAAGAGEWCGRWFGWSSRCDEGLTCELDWAWGDLRSGTCSEPAPTCGDGTQLLCRRAALPCPEGEVREIVDSCYGRCVDRASCEPISCEYEGQFHPIGSSFPASDGCNTCGCQEGGIAACTLRLCECNYDDPTVTWVARTPDECAVINFLCVEGTRPFTNPCGCGCEPIAACRAAGCSGQLCVPPDAPGISTCEFRREYACYADAACEPQSDGECGWTQTEELTACIESARAQP
jgi:hypothetical protein